MSKPWFKISTDKWLDGSTRRELTDAERARWIDLLALCARYEGKYASTSGVINMTSSDLAWFWHEDESETLKLLSRMEACGKIKVINGHIEVINWQKYNPHHEEIRRLERNNNSCEDLCEDVRTCADLCEHMPTLPENQNQNQIKNNTQNQKQKYSETSEPFRLASYLLWKIRENNSGFKEPDIQKWAHNIDLMIRVDKRDADDIVQVIDWCQSDDFWKVNILSTQKLRDKYDNLFMKMNKDKPKKQVDSIDAYKEMFRKKYGGGQHG